MGRDRSITDNQLQMARDLIAEGFTQREAARKIGVSPSSLSRWLRKTNPEIPPPHVSPAALPKDPVARLMALRDAWITVAEQRTARLIDDSEPTSSNDAVIGGIATQRATDLHDRLSKHEGIPAELPADDEEARKAVMAVWYRLALGGSQAATVKLAEALGIKSAQQQPVLIAFADQVEEATGEDSHAPSETPSPA